MIYSVRAAKALLFLACLVVFTAAGRQSSAADSRGPVFSPSVDLALNQRVERCVADLAELESYAANGSSDGDLSEVLDLISEKKRCLLHHSRRAQAKKRKNSRKKRKKKASKKKKADNYLITF